MRSLSALLDFLAHQMTMQAVYQPVVILHLLTRGGFSSRQDLALTLSGYDGTDLSEWDRILMDNPKRWLAGKYNLLSYNAINQTFQLEVDLRDEGELTQAIALCETKITDWIRRASDRGQIDESEILRLYRVLDSAKQGEQYQVPESDPYLDDFALRMTVQALPQRYPHYPITQQPYNPLGFDVLVGKAENPIAFVNVKATPKPIPCFWLSEGERRFSLQHSERFLLAIVYSINLASERYQLAWQLGAIQPVTYQLTPAYWQACLPHSVLSKDERPQGADHEI